MASTCNNVFIAELNENGQITAKLDQCVRLSVEKAGDGAQVCAHSGVKLEYKVLVTQSTDTARVGRQGLIITPENESVSTLIKFNSEADCRRMTAALKELSSEQKSTFSERTDKDSATQYFQFYSYLSQQQNMMQDYVRTATYQRAMLANFGNFADKVVLDVGAGSGILSYFAVQAGARKVYAVEASNMAPYCEKMVKHNGLSDRIIVIPAKIEEAEIPEKVDTIISEPIGYMLFNERMIETYLHAKKFLKPGGSMFPTQGHLFITPFTDEALYQEMSTKSNFWCQQNFHGVDLTCLRLDSYNENLKQPVVDTFNILSCLAPAIKYPVDFLTAKESDLYVIDVPLAFNITTTGNLHGLAFWFDLAFIGSSETIWLSTSPTEPLTHWYQVRCLIKSPVFVKLGQTVTGRLVMRSNSRQSYDVEISVDIPGTAEKVTNILDLKNPYFRYGGQIPSAPAQHSTTSPTEQYYANNGYQTNTILINGAHDPQQQQQQPCNLAMGGASINPGSIPSVGQLSAQPGFIANRTSIGGGLAPTSFAQPAVASSQFGLSSQYMIGDYVAHSGGAPRT